MKISTWALCITALLVTSFSCSTKSDAAKKDIDFLFDTIEHVWLVTVEYTRKGQANEGLDICQKYVQERQAKIAEAGKRMSDAMFKDEVRLYFAERTQKNREVTDKYEDYLTKHLNVEQMKRFSDITAEMIAEKYMKNIQWTTDPKKFFMKALKENM